MKELKILILVCLLFLMPACTSTPDNQMASQINFADAVSTTAAQTIEASAVTPVVPTIYQQTTPDVTLPPVFSHPMISPVTVDADLVNLRSGPGTFFANLASLSLGTQVTPVGMIADGTWIKINATLADGTSSEGWVFESLLDLSSLESSLPIIELPAEQTISGRVTDKEGEPINAVRVAATILTEAGIIRAESTSNRSGYFYIHTPPDLIGSFNVEIVAVNCSSNISNILSDGTCMVQEYFPIVWRASVLLPQFEVIHFIYEKGVTFLEGKVVYQDGNGASQILLKATRTSDGAESEFVTPQGGAFHLPLGLGTWEVIAIRFLSDGTPLLSETHVYEITTPGELVEPLIISYTEIIER